MDENQEAARLLIDLNEPEALLESLRRTCQAKADSFAEGEIPPEEAERWRTAANALSQAMTTITQAQEPLQAPNEPGEANPQLAEPSTSD